MEESVSKFLESLREEVIHHKDKRATFVVQKLVSIAALFSLGSGQFGSVNFPLLLFTVPFVSLALDVYISAEDYKVKRIGTFFRIYRYATPAERDWERFVNQHRERVAVWASLTLTAIAVLASAFVLYVQNSAIGATNIPLWPEIFWGWAFVAAALTAGVFFYYSRLMGKLPKPHLLEHQVHELLSAPGEDSLESLRDKTIIALILNTGITPEELVRIEIADLHQEVDGSLALRVRHHRGCKERKIPYRKPDEVLGVVEKWEKETSIQQGLAFPGDVKGLDSPKQMGPHQIDGILKKYHIVSDGMIRTVKPEELRLTYARRLYEDGSDLATIQRNLGCRNIETALGYIGPIAAQREIKQTSFW
jgi:integrase